LILYAIEYDISSLGPLLDITMANALTLEIHDNNLGWVKAGELTFAARGEVRWEYDLDYAAEHLGRLDSVAFSINMPVDVRTHKGELPPFILDLVPQGEPLKRLLRRYQIGRDDAYDEILARVPLASPGNIRIAEPWRQVDQLRDGYHEAGFLREDIISYKREFVEYMERHGAPIGGTTGAGGGSPKFLLRQDAAGRFHADGMLDDALTTRAVLLKFPYTDSQNSRELLRVEKIYYDFLRELPLVTGDALEFDHDVLFINRFDRQRDDAGRLCYHGLESFYSAHGIAVHGARLQHEDNLRLLARRSSEPAFDMIEYIKRDLVNVILANSDNHGRNWSLIKRPNEVRLSPIYDVTAMRFFEGDFIVELTRWEPPHVPLAARLAWVQQTFASLRDRLVPELRLFLAALGNVEERLTTLGVNRDFLSRSKIERDQLMSELKAVLM